MIEWNMTLMAWTHLVYLTVTAGITIAVGRSLKKHGKVFATNGQERDSLIVDAFASLLEVGFYLLSFGAVNLALKSGGVATNTQSAIEVLSTKIGAILLILGMIHFAMTMVFAGLRNQRSAESPTPKPTLENFDGRRPQRQTV